MPGKPKTDIEVPVVRTAPVAISQAANDIDVVPRAAAQTPVIPGIRTCWIIGTAFCIKPLAIPIPAPLPHVAAHIVKSDWIRPFGSDRVGPAAVIIIPSHIIQRIPVSPGINIIGLSGAASSGVFPLGLRGQAKAVSVGNALYAPAAALRAPDGVNFINWRTLKLGTQPIGIFYGIVPGNINQGIIAAHCAPGIVVFF